jgi:hypothetical protein
MYSTVFFWKIEADFAHTVQHPNPVRMSYAPYTRLSCENSACTVLTDDYVFVTYGIGANQRMPLADWRIIIGGETVREDFIPVPAASEQTVDTTQDWRQVAAMTLMRQMLERTALEPPDQRRISFALLRRNVPRSFQHMFDEVLESLAIGVPEEPVQTPEPAQALEPVQAPAPVQADPIGTKLVWTATAMPLQNYRVAIQTKYGLLQVKQVSCSQPLGADYEEVKVRQMFPTYEAWFATLPPDGTVAWTLPQEMLTGPQRRINWSAKYLADGGTAEGIRKIQILWGVFTSVYYPLSLNQKARDTARRIAELRSELQQLTIEQDMTRPRRRNNLTRQLQKATTQLAAVAKVLADATPEEADRSGAPSLIDRYKHRLYIHTSKGKLQIAYDIVTQSIAVKVPIDGSWRRTDGLVSELVFVKSLLDLPFAIGAELHLSVIHRSKEIDLYA